MKTIKLKIKNEVHVDDYLRIYNSIVRFSFNRLQDGLSLKEIRYRCKEAFSNQNSWFVVSAIGIAEQLYKRHEDKKIIFGGKHNLRQYLRKNITKEVYKENRNISVNICGERLQYGNRLFDFDFSNNTITFKPNKDTKIVFEYKHLHKNLQKELEVLQNLINNREVTVTVSFNKQYIYLTYDESILKQQIFENLKENRVLGIDLNPNYIGLSILEFDKSDNFKVIHKHVFDLSKCTNKNKKKHEICQINVAIIKLVDYYKCSKVVIEDLNIQHKSLNRGKALNKMCLNDWCRNLTITHLTTLCNKHHVEIVKVNPAYSSQVGNILYGNSTTPDMIAASIEVARRGYKKFQKEWFYPNFKASLSQLNEQWKQTLADNCIEKWEDLFKLIKNSKLKYRVPLSCCISNNHGFSFKHKKSYITLYEFL